VNEKFIGVNEKFIGIKFPGVYEKFPTGHALLKVSSAKQKHKSELKVI